MPPLAALSAAILAMHRTARSGLADQGTLLALIRPVLPFERAWWGLNSGLQIHTTHTEGLGADYAEGWERLKDRDVIAKVALPRPGRAHLFDPAAFAAEPEFDAFLSGHGIRHVACIHTRQERMNLGAFLSLYRRETTFGEEEAMLFEALFPHMMDALTFGWRAERDARPGGGLGLRALARPDGLILSATAGFDDLLRQQWPDWHGPYLPPKLSAMLGRAGWIRLGGERLEWAYRGGNVALRSAPLGPIEVLTRREMDVAERFSRGEGHKAIAGALGIAPTTVRHYIRTIYAKLHVQDKAALAHKMMGDRG